jgi:diguanylate cyclase (GGDEF)-like protein/PAS domain S-box-containing protein
MSSNMAVTSERSVVGAGGPRRASPTTVVDARAVAADRTMAAMAARLREVEQRHQRLVEASPDVILLSCDGVVSYANPAAAALLGAAPEDLVGTRVLDLLHPGDHRKARRAVWATEAEGVDHGPYEYRLVGVDGSVVVLEAMNVAMVVDGVRCTQTVARGVTDRARARAALEHAANHDELTDLPNRRALRDHLRAALAAAGPGRGVAVLAVDVDDFMHVNHWLGHERGDRVLQSVATLLATAVDEGDMVARFAGAKFVVCTEGVGSPAAVDDLVDRLRSTLAVPFRAGPLDLWITLSIGVALVHEPTAGPEDLLAQATAAMYATKEAGPGGLAWFDEPMRARSRERLEIESALHRALEEGELVVPHQPSIRLSDGAIVGAEALLRWERPGVGLVAPAGFVPIAEETGMIIPVGRWVLGQACADAAAWQARHPGSRRWVAVNVSAIQLSDPDFVGVVAEVLAETGLDPALLSLELTEGTVMTDVNVAAARLAELKELGVRLSIDDFGTGYSSLARLRCFPIDELKIDRSFVSQLEVSAEDVAIVEAVLSVGRALGCSVVAEGVETPAQRAILASLDCDQAQGWLWSPAVPQDGFLDLLDAGAPASS